MSRAPISALVAATWSAGPAFAQAGGEPRAGLGLFPAIVVGWVVGWLAGIIFRGDGLDLAANVLYGIGGALLAGLLPSAFILSSGPGWAGPLIAAIAGAATLVLVFRLIRKTETWRRLHAPPPGLDQLEDPDGPNERDRHHENGDQTPPFDAGHTHRPWPSDHRAERSPPRLH